MSNKNISFLGKVSDERLIREYGRAKALIFTPELEYGLSPIEAIAAGTPVIAYGKGAIRETMIPYTDNKSGFYSVIFFDDRN